MLSCTNWPPPYLGQAVPQHDNHFIHADAAVTIQVKLCAGYTQADVCKWRSGWLQERPGLAGSWWNMQTGQHLEGSRAGCSLPGMPKPRIMQLAGRCSPVKARRAHLSQRSVWLCCSTRQSIWEAATWLLATLPVGRREQFSDHHRGASCQPVNLPS